MATTRSRLEADQSGDPAVNFVSWIVSRSGSTTKGHPGTTPSFSPTPTTLVSVVDPLTYTIDCVRTHTSFDAPHRNKTV